MEVVIAGSAFTGATVVDFGVGITVNSFVVDSDNQITAQISIASWAPVGPHNVCVTTPYGADCLLGAFTVTGKSTASPTGGAKSLGWGGTVYATDGTPVSSIVGWRRLTITRRVNAPDRVVVVLDGRHPAIPFLETDAMVHFYRENIPLGIPSYKEAEGFCRGRRHSWDDRAQYSFTGLFIGYEDLLDRRLLLGGDDEDYANGSYPAETVMKQVVAVQCGLSGTRNMISTAIQGLSVATDLGRGGLYGGYDQGQRLLTYLQELAEAQGMAFRVTMGTEVAKFIFKAWPNPYGADRTATGVVNGRNTAGFAPVIFSEERGNLTTLDYDHNRDGEGNVGVNVDSGTVVVGAAATDSPWNDREFWFSPNAGESVESAAVRELAKVAAREETDFVVIQKPHCAYGKHYFLGDLVTIYVAGQGVQKSLTKVITEVTLNIERRRGEMDEQVEITLADRPVPVKGAIAESLMNLSERVGRLERS
jgi:hypothetical protein